VNLWSFRSPTKLALQVRVGITNEELTALAAGEAVMGHFPSEALELTLLVVDPEEES
jgi:hypothetical protein